MKDDEFVAYLRGILAPYFLSQDTWIASGTYAPTYTGATTAGVTTYAANGQVGGWWRHGIVIFFRGRLEWTAATGTGNAQISLPPFTAASTTNLNAAISIDTNNITFANGTPQAIISAGGTVFQMRSPITNAGSAAVAVEAAGILNFGGFYTV